MSCRPAGWLGVAGNEMARMVDYLKTENGILRNKLSKRVSLTPGERERLITPGKPLGKKIKELIRRRFLSWSRGRRLP